jgi:WD40 repeat protein
VFGAAGDTVTGADLATGEPAGPALVHPGRVRAMRPAVLDGVPVVATGSDDRIVRVWEVATGRTLRAVTLPRPVHHILAVTADQLVVLDDGYLMAVG